MQLIYNGKKWVLYDDNGKVIVITRIRAICEGIMKDAKCVPWYSRMNVEPLVQRPILPTAKRPHGPGEV